ncbi:MAG: hypothetical protein JWM97_904 [Phycisphaerales bacterium]|nr:hypothetical protein [Phycisphaerales bacterium]
MQPIQKCFRNLMVLVATVSLGGCCGDLNPSPKQVEAWVSQEMPIGSSEDAVKRFSERHQFRYERDSADYGQAYRAVDGCDWKKPVIQVEVTYDEHNQVKSADVRGFSMLP